MNPSSWTDCLWTPAEDRGHAELFVCPAAFFLASAFEGLLFDTLPAMLQRQRMCPMRSSWARILHDGSSGVVLRNGWSCLLAPGAPGSVVGPLLSNSSPARILFDACGFSGLCHVRSLTSSWRSHLPEVAGARHQAVAAPRFCRRRFFLPGSRPGFF